MQPADLGRILVEELQKALHLRGAFLLLRHQDGTYRLQQVAHGEQSQGRAPPMLHDLSLDAQVVEEAFLSPPRPLLLAHARPLLPRNRALAPQPYRPFGDLGVALAVPLTTRSGIQAILCLQPKATPDDFEARDLEVLIPVLRQASAAFDNALLFARLDETVDELKSAYVRLAHEQDAERARLARELHDGTAQELAAMITLTSVLARQMDGENAPARQTLDRLRQ
jgi:signal transduction histidine kinase